MAVNPNSLQFMETMKLVPMFAHPELGVPVMEVIEGLLQSPRTVFAFNFVAAILLLALFLKTQLIARAPAAQFASVFELNIIIVIIIIILFYYRILFF